VDRDAFDAVMAGNDNAMVIATTATEHERAGCLVGFHSQCSIEPPRYAVWLSKANHTCRVAVHAGHIALHFLSEADHDLAELFGERTGDDVDKFSRCSATDGPHHVPLLDDVADVVLFRRTAFLDEGSDHVCFTLEPLDVVSGPSDNVRMRLSDVGDLTPGHTATERPEPRDERSPE
jgi:flavin reductase (DIM6/NTAB) family NADH-FMN oxidoreductase RutF